MTREKQFIKVVVFKTDGIIGFEYCLIDAQSKIEAYLDREFNEEVCKHYKDDKTFEMFNNDLVIDIQELRNNAGSSLNFGRQIGENHLEKE